MGVNTTRVENVDTGKTYLLPDDVLEKFQNLLDRGDKEYSKHLRKVLHLKALRLVESQLIEYKAHLRKILVSLQESEEEVYLQIQTFLPTNDQERYDTLSLRESESYLKELDRYSDILDRDIMKISHEEYKASYKDFSQDILELVAPYEEFKPFYRQSDSKS